MSNNINEKRRLEKERPTVISLLMLPILNYANWECKDNNYVSLADLAFVTNEQSDIKQMKRQSWFNWRNSAKQDKIIEFTKLMRKKIAEGKKITGEILNSIVRDKKKIVFINYTLEEEALKNLEEETKLTGAGGPFLFMLTAPEDILKLREENFICPLCERSWKKRDQNDDKIFECPEDGITIGSEDAKEFTENFISYYITMSLQLLEKRQQGESQENGKFIPLKTAMNSSMADESGDLSREKLEGTLEREIDRHFKRI